MTVNRIDANGVLPLAKQLALAFDLHRQGDAQAALSLLGRVVEELVAGRAPRVRDFYRGCALTGLLSNGWPATQDRLDEVVRASCYAGDAMLGQ
jgi:hypothetical protein